ncbi:MAG: hypothetical protein AAF702_27200 [Chloroflexota bacterium]
MNAGKHIRNEVNPLPIYPSVPPVWSPDKTSPVVSSSQPMIHVEPKRKWRYKTLVCTPDEAVAMAEKTLNQIGAEGWELCGTLTFDGKVCFYFKLNE